MNAKKVIGTMAASAALMIGSITTASAAAHNSSDHYGTTGRCDPTNGAACLYYNSGERGSVFRLQQPIAISNLYG